MRAARPGNARHKTLRIQADVPHTFGPLLVPLSLILVIWGGYSLNRAVSHPLEADAAGILFASSVLACGLLLAAFLARSVHLSVATIRKPDAITVTTKTGRSRSTPPRPPKPAPVPRPFHRFYVDDVRVSR
ncbi:MAG TPA: hypothetical protein VKT53_11440 [Candidatus Acidoferrum sp.]|nr:hypothetical protein [Candidatus Acidoferrum sp.]